MKLSTKHTLESVHDLFAGSVKAGREVVSAFIGIDQRDPQNSKQLPRWSQELNNALFDLSYSDIAALPENMKSWTEVEAHVLSLVEGNHLSTPSIAIFSCGVRDLVVPLPSLVETEVDIGIPQLGKLLSYTEGYDKYCVILFSEMGHRIIVINHSSTENSTIIESEINSEPVPVTTDNDAISEASEGESAAVDINEHFFSIPDYRQMIFGGNIRIAQGVKYSLHNAIAEHLVTLEPLAFDIDDEDLCQSVQQIAANQQRLKDMTLLNELSMLGSNVSVFGLDSTYAALLDGRVKKVVLPYPFDTEKCNPLIIEAITQGAELEIVYGAPAQRLSQLGGVAGVLYERFETFDND